MIEAKKQSVAKDLQINTNTLTPRNLLAPGCAIINENGQGMTRMATAGGIVRDGERYYVLTNRHAVGAPGTKIEALQTHRHPEIGVSAAKGITREEFRKIYPHFASVKQFLLMDVGLVDLDDVLQWKTEVPGISPVGPVLDLYDNSLTLKLIGMKVVGQSAVTGLIRGEIHGLFYRFKAMGGSEYISDFLIGPETTGHDAGIKEEKGENVSLAVHHGDSGALLFVEHAEKNKNGGKKAQKKSITRSRCCGAKKSFSTTASAPRIRSHWRARLARRSTGSISTSSATSTWTRNTYGVGSAITSSAEFCRLRSICWTRLN